jgi:hypothetical protein
MIGGPLAIGTTLLKGNTMNRRILSSAFTGISIALLGTGGLVAGDDGDGERGRGRDRPKFVVHADLVGTQEVPIVSTGANGHFHAVVDTVMNTITWTLRYEGLEGTVTQAHVHIGQRNVNGGISFFMCSNLTTPAPPPGTAACPAPAGELSGVITPENIIGPTGQGIPAAAFAEVVENIRDGLSYANVHTSLAPGGEIRGQLH